ncbi:MAG: c-type cytochrome [Acidobacteria bacterium]|nr:c-type cytochrome [Acidobacteriota bacterium]
MKRSVGLFALGLIALVLIALGALAWTQTRAGISAREEPSALEAALARAMRTLAIPADAKELENPLEPSDTVLVSARAHWADHCASCHGNDGKGQTEMGQGLYPKAPDMTHPDTQSLSDGELAYIIRNGIRLTGMPAWGEPGTPPSEADWELVHFIRHLPEITSEELEQMEAMNPVSLHELEEQRAMEAFLAGEDVETNNEAPPLHGERGHHH